MTKRVYEQKMIEPQDFDKLIKKLRGFFMQLSVTTTKNNLIKLW
jgi:hypothetical protein